MARASVAELKAKLSEYIARAKAGEDVLVTERGRAVARLVPVRGAAAAEARLGELERAGLLRRARTPLAPELWQTPGPPDPEGLSLRYLLEEREEDR
jgi:prevent-host-death family protein